MGAGNRSKMLVPIEQSPWLQTVKDTNHNTVTTSNFALKKTSYYGIFRYSRRNGYKV